MEFKYGAKNFKSNFLLEKKDEVFSLREKGASYNDISLYLNDKYKIKISAITISRFFRKE
ncbi:hypothetical protein ZW22_004374 [Salmonella enterica subsp. enterica serovar Oranienburg]|nr:hypothetical protein [Salmonella enterica subsp. enterica serovar Oranienburg]